MKEIYTALLVILIIILTLFFIKRIKKSESFGSQKAHIQMNGFIENGATVGVSQTIVNNPILQGFDFSMRKYYSWCLVSEDVCFKPIWLHINTIGGTGGTDVVEYPGRLLPGNYSFFVYTQLYTLHPDRLIPYLCWDRELVEDKNGLAIDYEFKFKVVESPTPDDLIPLTRKYSRDYQDTCIGAPISSVDAKKDGYDGNTCHNVVNSIKIGCVKRIPSDTTRPLYRAYAPNAQKTCVNTTDNLQWDTPQCHDATSKDWNVTGYIEKERTRTDLIPLYNAYHKVPNISGNWEGLIDECGVTPEHPYCHDVPASNWRKLGYIYPSNLC